MVVIVEKGDNEKKIVGYFGEEDGLAGTMYVVRAVKYGDGGIGIYGVGRWYEIYKDAEEVFEKLMDNLDKVKEAFEEAGLIVRNIEVDEKEKKIVVDFDIIDSFMFVEFGDVDDEKKSLEELVKESIQYKIEDMLFCIASRVFY